MLEDSCRFVCDLCGEAALGEMPELPPPGFALLKVRPEHGVGAVAHLCLRTCLVIGAERLATGLTLEGHPRGGTA
jgi:hypothetical protein